MLLYIIFCCLGSAATWGRVRPVPDGPSAARVRLPVCTLPPGPVCCSAPTTSRPMHVCVVPTQHYTRSVHVVYRKCTTYIGRGMLHLYLLRSPSPLESSRRNGKLMDFFSFFFFFFLPIYHVFGSIYRDLVGKLQITNCSECIYGVGKNSKKKLYYGGFFFRSFIYRFEGVDMSENVCKL